MPILIVTGKQFNFKTKPYDHQLEALHASHDKDEYALFMEMGCGKSKVVIDNLAYYMDKVKSTTH